MGLSSHPSPLVGTQARGQRHNRSRLLKDENIATSLGLLLALLSLRGPLALTLGINLGSEGTAYLISEFLIG